MDIHLDSWHLPKDTFALDTIFYNWTPPYSLFHTRTRMALVHKYLPEFTKYSNLREVSTHNQLLMATVGRGTSSSQPDSSALPAACLLHHIHLLPYETKGNYPL